MERRFFHAAEDGDAGAVAAVLAGPNARRAATWKNKTVGSPTALHAAAQNGHDDVVRLLLARQDVDVNAQDDDEATPLYMACTYGHAGAARLLLEDARVDVRLAYVDGATPFWQAARNGHLAVIQVFLALRGDVVDLVQKHEHYADKKRYTALEIAELGEHQAVVALLTRYAADPDGTREHLRADLEPAPANQQPSVSTKRPDDTAADGASDAPANNTDTDGGRSKRRRRAPT